MANLLRHSLRLIIILFLCENATAKPSSNFIPPTRSYTTPSGNTHYYNQGRYLGYSYSTKHNAYYRWNTNYNTKKGK